MGEIEFDFTGRSVVVTGAAQGIGRAIAERFAAAGARVVLVDIEEEALIEAASGSLQTAVSVPGDVRDPATAEQAMNAAVDAAGKVDILVNNAGVLRDGMVWKLTDDDWETVLGVHLTGTFNFVRAAVPIMREFRYGRIINVTSYSGLRGNVGQANYSSAKAGIIGLTKTTARELAPFGITVNAISPNAHTAMVEGIPERRRIQIEGQIPAGRFGSVEEMSAVAAFLASAEAGYLTGIVLPIDGGLSI